jgi:HD-GYP domain-containing protein (c-di-GMP phosphodiesterase class II)
MVRYVDLIQDAPIKREELQEKEADPLKSRKLGKEDMEEYRKIYVTVQEYLEGVRRRVTRHMDFDLEPAIDFLYSTIGTPDLITKLYQFTSEYGHEEDFTISHSINTMILSLKVGQGMGFSKDKLFELGLSALFHDIGMFLVPDDILRKPDRLTQEESDAVRKHPEMGRDILSIRGGSYPWLSEVVYQHHEREEGQGYPRGLRGDRIHEYAKILGIVDTYEAMTHNRPHRRAISVRELIESKNQQFAPRIIKVFLEQISLYPIGSYVKLNNKSLAKVIDTNDHQPLRPVVNVLFDSQGNRMKADQIVNLKDNSLLWVIGNVSETELPAGA